MSAVSKFNKTLLLLTYLLIAFMVKKQLTSSTFNYNESKKTNTDKNQNTKRQFGNRVVSIH